MKVVLIAAVTKDYALDFDFVIKEDRERFRALTLNYPVIMGRKTYEAMNKHLEGRLNIVVSRNRKYDCSGAVVCHSIDEALNLCDSFKSVYVIGGGEIYQQTIDRADRLEITHIFTTHDGKVTFPKINSDWKKKNVLSRSGYQFVTYERR